MATPVHGGDLANAMALARSYGFDAGEASDWLDLSTGINPNPYPVPPLDPDLWNRLPSHSSSQRLVEAAARYYGAPDVDHIIAVPGTALAIQMLPRLLEEVAPEKPVMIVSPTYGDHKDSWQLAGREVIEDRYIENADFDGISVLVNPNNPTGAQILL